MNNLVKIIESDNDEKIMDYQLVLEAFNIHFEVQKYNDLWEIFVYENQEKKAIEEINLFCKENKKEPVIFNKFYKLTIEFLILIPTSFSIFFIIHKKNLFFNWLDFGYASADKIYNGEWWLAVTALTLHSDLNHIMGNIVFGSIIIFFLSRLCGFGFAFFLTMLSGFSGNIINAYYYQISHNSIGFSTAVFGALGVLTGLQVLKEYRFNKKRFWIPIGAALGLLAMIGSGGQNTDLSAHFFGLISGIIIGLIISISKIKIYNIKKTYQYLFLIISYLSIIMSWAIVVVYHVSSTSI